tara:strand:+ start:172 stop:330 length:159 start_codon:yes stop_codon:yes gene_type:complete
MKKEFKEARKLTSEQQEAYDMYMEVIGRYASGVVLKEAQELNRQRAIKYHPY